MRATRRLVGAGLTVALVASASSVVFVDATPRARAAVKSQGDVDLEARLVLAVTEPDGGICIITEGAELAAGERLLAFAIPPAVAATWSVSTSLTVVAAGSECGLVEPAAPEQRFYRARADPARVPDPAVMIALRDPPEIARVDEAQAWADVNGDGRVEAFRACASAEGLHLSVWRGFPIPRERIWHRYYYLGYDVEPTCEDPGR